MSTALYHKLVKLITGFPLALYLIAFIKDWVVAIAKTGPIPRHVGFIMDGNRRFAKQHQLKLAQGHEQGAETLIKLLDVSYLLGIEHVSVYAFSIENFKRSQAEIDTLFGLLRDKLRALAHFRTPTNNLVAVRVIGNRQMIPEDILVDLEEIERTTAHHPQVLNVCFPYTSRDEIAHSMRQCVADDLANGGDHTTVNEEALEAALYFGPNTPKLDLLIRTSGHQRLSDFMLWQCSANCTVEFSNVLWPAYGYWECLSSIIRWGYARSVEMDGEAHEI